MYVMFGCQYLKVLEWLFDDEVVVYVVQDGLVDMFGWYENEIVLQYWKFGGVLCEVCLIYVLLLLELVQQFVYVVNGIMDFLEFGLIMFIVEVEIVLCIGCLVLCWEVDIIMLVVVVVLIYFFVVFIEIVSLCWEEGFDVLFLLCLVDLQLNGVLVLGEWLFWQFGCDWFVQVCLLQVNDEVFVYVIGMYLFGDFVWGLVVWIKYVMWYGEMLFVGSVVIIGVWIVCKDLKVGDCIIVGFDGIGVLMIQF